MASNANATLTERGNTTIVPSIRFACLKGQRVGITSATGSLYAGTVLALNALGLTTSDVTLSPLGSITNVNSSLLAGSIAAAVSHPPATYRFERAGLVDLVDLAKKKLPSVNGGVWVPRAYLEAHRGVVQAVVDALTEALLREKSDRAYTESEITRHLGVKDKGELDFTYDFYLNDVLPPGPMPKAAQLQANITDLSATNPKVKSVDIRAIIDQSFVKNAEK